VKTVVVGRDVLSCDAVVEVGRSGNEFLGCLKMLGRKCDGALRGATIPLRPVSGFAGRPTPSRATAIFPAIY
jgi:hypothetical protein